jgi:hypothetical protein
VSNLKVTFKKVPKQLGLGQLGQESLAGAFVSAHSHAEVCSSHPHSKSLLMPDYLDFSVTCHVRFYLIIGQGFNAQTTTTTYPTLVWARPTSIVAICLTTIMGAAVMLRISLGVCLDHCVLLVSKHYNAEWTAGQAL